MANIQLSKNLRYKRKQYNLTQEDISAKLNISRQAYSNYETGKRIPDLDSLTYLCHIFNLSLDELVYQNLENQIHEEKGPYTPAIDVKSGNMLYLTKEETQLLLKFRNADADTRLLMEKLLF